MSNEYGFPEEGDVWYFLEPSPVAEYDTFICENSDVLKEIISEIIDNSEDMEPIIITITPKIDFIPCGIDDCGDPAICYSDSSAGQPICQKCRDREMVEFKSSDLALKKMDSYDD